MNERQERIERLAERWFAAQATDAEERELREWMRRAADVPESLREVRTLFGGLDALAGERSPERWKPRRIRRMAPLWGIAAAAAVVLGIFVCADLLRKPYCYIDGWRCTTRRWPCKRRSISNRSPLWRSRGGWWTN